MEQNQDTWNCFKTQGKTTRLPDQFLNSRKSNKTPGTVSRLKEKQQDFQISF